MFPLLADLSHFGVPQTRKRAFLTFVRFDERALPDFLASGRVPYPQPTHSPEVGGKPISLIEALRSLGASRLDARSAKTAADPVDPFHFVPVWSEDRYAMVRAIPPHSGRSAWQTSKCLACGPVQMRKNAVHCPECGLPLPRPLMRVAGRQRLIRGFANSTYRRMPSHSPAQTITTASGRIGGNYTIHPFETGCSAHSNVHTFRPFHGLFGGEMR